MKKVSVAFPENCGTVIDYEMTDEDYLAYCDGDKELTDILGTKIIDDAYHDFAEYGSEDGMEIDVINVREI